MFYSWDATLEARGLRAAASALLNVLRSRFRSRQLAASGYTSLPLLAGCVLLGDGVYTGIAVRSEPKPHGSCRQIEGAGDRNYPVVVLDDSISSGTSFRRTVAALEQDGYEVEGVVALVNFPQRGGVERATALGYNVAYLFDVWRDLQMPQAPYVPGWQRAQEAYDEQRITDGLHPAIVARETAQHFLETGGSPRPPKGFDRLYSAPGGVFVSFRLRNSNERLGRDGFWHFCSSDADPLRDILLATIKAIRSSKGRVNLGTLSDCKIAVTLLGVLEEVGPRDLDFCRFGIVVRSASNPWKTGGALPSTQVFTSEFEQYRHARWQNARVTDFEDHHLYRHTVEKCVEPGAEWQSYGAPDGPELQFQFDDELGSALLSRVEHLIGSYPAAPSDDLDFDCHVPVPLYGVSVAIYRAGLIGCSVASGGSIDDCLRRATAAALRDSRFAAERSHSTGQDLSFTVTLLFEREHLGKGFPVPPLTKLRIGLDALGVAGEEGHALYLPCVGVHYCWRKERLAYNLLKKAGIKSRPHDWFSYRGTSWLRHGSESQRLEYGYPVQRQVADPVFSEIAHRHATYILRQIGPSGLPAYCYFPVQDTAQEFGTAGRIVHALYALHLAGVQLDCARYRNAARAALEVYLRYVRGSNEVNAVLALPGQKNGSMADAQFLIWLTSAGLVDCEAAARLAGRVRGWVRPDGRISPEPMIRLAADHDFLPGVALLGLANYTSAGGFPQILDGLQAQFQWYRRRFEMMHSWGMVGWHTQAWRAVGNMSLNTEADDFIFHLADWALSRQLECNGAFLTDLDTSGPSFHTAFILEGIVAAWQLAAARGDESRRSAYERSWRDGLGLIASLTIDERSSYCAKRPVLCIGGVRGNRQSSAVRIDFVSHTLLAVLGGMALLK